MNYFPTKQPMMPPVLSILNNQSSLYRLIKKRKGQIYLSIGKGGRINGYNSQLGV